MQYSEALDIRNSFFHNVPQAKKGKKIIDRYLEKNDSDGLNYLLRWHYPEGISDDETWDRDNIDYFIESFCLLSLADIVGVFSEPIPVELKIESAYYLGNCSIKRFYSKYYKLILPQILLHKVLLSKSNNQNDVSNSKSTFYKFMRLNNGINNEDVDRFLWLLDGGVYEEDSKDIHIDTFKTLLRNTKQILYLLERPDEDEINCSLLIGFFRYCEFCKDYSAFLNGITKNRVAQSSYWHYHSYWFTRIQKKLKSTINSFFEGLDKVKSEGMANMDASRYLNLLQNQKKTYTVAFNNLFNSTKYSVPLEEYFTKLKKSK